LKEGLTPAQILERIYLRCLTRKPTSEELSTLEQMIAQVGNPQIGLEDAFWAVLNSREFMFKH
jgi:hypothetical protein